MCDRQKDLCLYRYNNAIDTLEAACHSGVG